MNLYTEGEDIWEVVKGMGKKMTYEEFIETLDAKTNRKSKKEVVKSVYVLRCEYLDGTPEQSEEEEEEDSE